MTHRNETDTDLPAADNVVPFPVNAKLTRARRERFERLAYEGNRPRFNAKIKAAYFEATRGGRFE